MAVKILPGKIEHIFPNPARNNVTITCVFNYATVAAGTYLTISNNLGVIYDSHNITTGYQNIDFNIFHYPAGSYIVRLICNGIVVDSKVFAKE